MSVPQLAFFLYDASFYVLELRLALLIHRQIIFSCFLLSFRLFSCPFYLPNRRKIELLSSQPLLELFEVVLRELNYRSQYHRQILILPFF
jgi:hypothetical protein